MSLHETPSRMEPVRLEGDVPVELLDLVTGIGSAARDLEGRLRPASAASLAALVRVMNCYHSNLIEGHNTTLREIEAALSGRLSPDAERRDLQIEARAHIRAQASLDLGHAAGTLPEATGEAFIRELHRQFYGDASEQMLQVRSEDGRVARVVPGEYRAEEVRVGRHLPPAPEAIPAFMAAFERRFRHLGAGARVLALPAAHHRLNFIHPFLDGNGRVSRLMSHAMALHAGIGAHGLWSIARGLARGIESRAEYKRMMDHADTPRQGDLDGRGTLSRRALVEFSEWFLRVCLDQIQFMTTLFALETLNGRLREEVERQGWRPEAATLLREALHRGEVPRGEAAAITGLRERTARDLVATLTSHGILASPTPKAPVSLAFPRPVAERLFPALMGG